MKIVEHLFRSIQQYSKIEAVKAYPVLSYLSYNPKHILYDENTNKFKPNFEYAMCSYLNLLHLPLTSEQRLIYATPDPNADIYLVI